MYSRFESQNNSACALSVTESAALSQPWTWFITFDLPNSVEAEVEPLQVDQSVEPRDPLNEVVVQEEPLEREQRLQVLHLQDEPELEAQRRRRLQEKVPARRAVISLRL